MLFADFRMLSTGSANQRAVLLRIIWPPTMSTSTEGTIVSPSRASTSLARNWENGSPRRRSTTSLTMLRASTNTNAISIARTPADSAYTTTSVRKSGLISAERSASTLIATSAAIRTRMPRRIRRGLSRSGRRSAGVRGGCARDVPTGRGVVAGRTWNPELGTPNLEPRTFGTCWNLFLGVEQILELRHELTDVAEVPIHGGKTDVGHLVEGPQFVHDEGSDFFRAHLTLRLLLQGRLDTVGDPLEGGDADRTLFAGLEQPGHEFLPLESFAAAVFLDHHVRDLVDPFVAGEPPAAAQTFTAPADDLPFLALPRVDDLVAEVRAVGTLHRDNTPDSPGDVPGGPDFASCCTPLKVRPSRAMKRMPTSVTGMNEIPCSTIAAPTARSEGAAKKVCTAI